MSSLSRAARAALCCTVGMMTICGCRRRESGGAGTSAPAAALPAATALPTTRPAAALWINGAAYRFPPATLVLSSQGQGTFATLCSDDPPTAINADYRGNSFMIQMKLDANSVNDLDGYIWRTVANPAADVDTAAGVFLGGTARQLEPTALTVNFHKRGTDLIVDLDGQFQSVDSRNPSAQRQPATVTGRLYTRVVEQH